MKTAFEPQEIEAIAQRVAAILKPMLSKNGKSESKDEILNKKELEGEIWVRKRLKVGLNGINLSLKKIKGGNGNAKLGRE